MMHRLATTRPAFTALRVGKWAFLIARTLNTAAACGE